MSAASNMFLYWGSGSPPCWRIMIALEEKNLQGYQNKMLSFEKKEHKSDEVLAINPRGQVSEVVYYTWLVPENERHDSAVKRNLEALCTELKLWEGYLKKLESGSFITGKNFTMADVMFFPQVAYAFRYGLSQEKFPRLTDYYSHVKERPSIQATWPPHWKESPQAMDLLKDL
ncbi:GSTA transferase, partial [Polypterus senegalus]